MTPPAISAFLQNGELANSSSEYFNFIAKDETLELTHNIQVVDNSACNRRISSRKLHMYEVCITGTNDKPDITIVDVTGAVTEDQDTITSNGIEVLRDSGKIDFSDIDITDRSNAEAELVSVIDDLGDDITTLIPPEMTAAISNALTLTGDGVEQKLKQEQSNGNLNWTMR